MKSTSCSRCCAVAFVAVLALAPATASACATCFGKSDSPMARGMNAGIFALLLVITSVLLAIAVFFFYILRRAARLAATPAATGATEPASFSQPLSQPTP